MYGEVLRAWNEAGRLPFEPGEYEQAVLAAADLVELRYEARGKLLVKQAKAAAAATEDKTGKNGAASKGGRKKDPLEAVAEGGALSDKDQAIVDGLLDKTAPAEGSQRARPRGINSELRNGSPRGSSSSAGMDSRDALRDVLAANGLTPR